MKNIRELFFFIFANLAHTNFISMQKWLALQLFTISCFAQSHKIVVVDGETGIPIEKCFIESDNGKGFYTDAKGKITLPKNIDQISIAHLGYESWSGTLTDTIFLKPDIISLENVSVGVRQKIMILPKRSLNTLLPHNAGTGNHIQFDTEMGVYIPNEDITKQKLLKKIVLHPTGYRTLSLDSGKFTTFDEAKFSPFQVNLWTVMPEVGIPQDSIYSEPLEARLAKGKDYVVIDLPDGGMMMPEDGIFIVISSFPKEYYISEKTIVPTAPAFYRIGTSSDCKFKMYSRNKFEGFWKRDDWYWQNKSVYLAGFEVEIIP